MLSLPRLTGRAKCRHAHQICRRLVNIYVVGGHDTVIYRRLVNEIKTLSPGQQAVGCDL